MKLTCFYKKPAITKNKKENLLSIFRESVSSKIEDIETEVCFYVETTEPLKVEETNMLQWLLSETFKPENLSAKSFLLDPKEKDNDSSFIVEVGPRLNFATSWSTNAVSICHSCGIAKIKRMEKSRRYHVVFISDFQSPVSTLKSRILPFIHDRMTECPYPESLQTLDIDLKREPVYTVPLMEEGKEALMKTNEEIGLGLDEWDMDYYYDLFTRDIRRNPTNVECFDLGQSNSEHSRHWFFRGRLIIDGKESAETLMNIVKDPFMANPRNSVIAFKDNSSAIRGYAMETILPEKPGKGYAFHLEKLTYHILFTAETHNFPTGVAPFQGSETGTGGRIRDVHATGRGSLAVAGTAAYCVGNLNISGYELPWEDRTLTYPANLATPLEIEIEASNGASDYGNKFGEPLIQGFTRSFGLKMSDGERREWIKPIMFTGGVGQMDARHVEKGEPQKGMLVVKIGGPAYRIGIGGGAASSMIQGENIDELDFSAVQRGDAEMEQKTNRVIRTCVEMGKDNPIISIHDQGAGGNSNVVKEIINPAGASIEIRNILSGDRTLSVLELWGAEYQENDALLLEPEKVNLFKSICEREKVPVSIIGEITGDGFVILCDSIDGSTPVNLELSKVLGKMPQKIFRLERVRPTLESLRLPKGLTVRDALERVLRLLPVGSKRFLTNKVDRSVTGLISQQQCTGPLQLPLSNVAVIAQNHFGKTGAAISIGEQPVKGLIDPPAMARMSVGEALTNLVWAQVTDIEDIKCSANWMWAAKLPGEGAKLCDAAKALRDMLLELGMAIDGGKDSLSMAAIVPKSNDSSEIVKSPGTLVISAYVTCTDISRVITPDIKRPGESRLIYIDLGNGRHRLGGSALAHVYGQTGDESPDVEDPALLKRTFQSIQRLISKDLILSGHDRSDGGLITALLEMAFAGNSGLEVSLNVDGIDSVGALFSEELGIVIEYLPGKEDLILKILHEGGLSYQVIGKTVSEKVIKVKVNPITLLEESMPLLRDRWEETSYRIDRLQANPICVDEERRVIRDRTGPSFKSNHTPEATASALLERNRKPKVAILREEGSNGDREMASAFYQAGFEVWDITITDLMKGDVSLNDFRGVAFVGGFSYADVLGSARGWAGVIRFDPRVYDEFENFYDREDTFSLGVCNGCQLMTLIGWIPWKGIDDKHKPRFIHNLSDRFESRFSTVEILPGPSIMLKGMEESVLGVWIAHGEGRAHFPDHSIMNEVTEKSLAPIRYVDDSGERTEVYPFNPNGSPHGITALCSPDGRHLAMMPHPERTFLKWQWGWMPEKWKANLKASPWLTMFQNARIWCEK